MVLLCIRRRRRGVGLLEYGVLASLLAIVVVVAITMLGARVNYQYCYLSGKVGANGQGVTSVNTPCIKDAWAAMYGFNGYGSDLDNSIAQKCAGNGKCYAIYQSNRFMGDNEGFLTDLSVPYDSANLPYASMDADQMAKDTCQRDYGTSSALSGCEQSVTDALMSSPHQWFETY